MNPRKMCGDLDAAPAVLAVRHNCVELSRGFGRLMRFCKIHDIQPWWLTMWALFPGTLDAVNCLLKFMDFTQEKLRLPPIADWGPAWESEFTRPCGRTNDTNGAWNRIKP